MVPKSFVLSAASRVKSSGRRSLNLSFFVGFMALDSLWKSAGQMVALLQILFYPSLTRSVISSTYFNSVQIFSPRCSLEWPGKSPFFRICDDPYSSLTMSQTSGVPVVGGQFLGLTFRVILARSSCRSMMPCTRLRKSLQVGQARRRKGKSPKQGWKEEEEQEGGI